MLDWPSIIVAVVVAIVANLGSLVAANAVRKRTIAEAERTKTESEKTRTDSAGMVVDKAMLIIAQLEKQTKEQDLEIITLKNRILELEPLQGRVSEMETRLNALESENCMLRDGGIRLENQVVGLGEEPVWRVPRIRHVSEK